MTHETPGELAIVAALPKMRGGEVLRIRREIDAELRRRGNPPIPETPLEFLVGLRFGPDLERKTPGSAGTWRGVAVVDLGNAWRVAGAGILSTRDAVRHLETVSERRS